jgi:signal transduction histidine kinase
MNNLIAAKIFLFIAAVLSALAAVYTDYLHQIFGFTASAVCFIAFLILLFYKPEESGSAEEDAPLPVKKYQKNYEAPAAPAYVPPVRQEPKQDVPQYKSLNMNSNFQQNKENEFSKEELMNDKIKLLNKFASVASHDLKNPLSSMKNIAYYFTNSVKIEGEVPNKMLRMLSSEVDRMNNMIVELLDSTRVKQLNKSSCDLTAVINESVEKNKNDKYAFELNLQPLQVYADPDRIRQVFSSIIQNAEEAMPDGGSITVKSYKSANEAYIEISDTGTGMDADTLAHCFDPMFSTKQARALGMSLTVSKQIITMHGGTVKAESAVGKGSKFIINIPLAV